MSSELTWCCGRAAARIALTDRPVEIALLTCAGCDGRTWLLDGRAADRDAALAALGSVARANRYGLPPRLPAGWSAFPWAERRDVRAASA